MSPAILPIAKSAEPAVPRTVSPATGSFSTPAVPRNSSRPALNEVRRDQSFAAARIGRSQASELIERQAHFAFGGTGPLASRTIVPQTLAAQKLLAGKDGEQLRMFLRGALSAVDARGGSSNLKGISLSTGQDGFALNSYLGDRADASTTIRRTNTASARRAESSTRTPQRTSRLDVGRMIEIEDAVKESRVGRSSALAFADSSGWIDLSPKVSKTVVALAKNPSSVPDYKAQMALRTLDHELHHTVTPSPLRHLSFEEGTAELFSLHPTMASGFAKSVGVPYRRIAGSESSVYPKDTQNVRTILKLAGINPQTKSGIGDAYNLIQNESHHGLGARLADRMIEHHKIDPIHRATVRRAAASAVADPQKVAKLDQVLRKLATGQG